MIQYSDKNTVTITPAVSGLRGEITVPGDKSISHRAVMFGAIAEGTTEVTHSGTDPNKKLFFGHIGFI